MKFNSTKPVKAVQLFLTLGLVATMGACTTPASEEVEGGEAETEVVNSGGEGGEAETEAVSSGGEGGEAETEAVSSGGEGGEAETGAVSSGGEGGEGGEGDEGGEGGGTGDVELDYMTSLALMKGHLMVADELLTEGDAVAAEPHIGHLVEELYGGVAEQLSDRGVDDFKPTLSELHDLVKSSPDAPAVKEAYRESITAIDEAIAAVGDDKLQDPEFVMQVANAVLKVAGEQYTAAIAEDKFTEEMAYQDSRGFVMSAETLYRGVADQLEAKDAKAIATTFEDLKTAWPDINPPDAPVKTPQEVLGRIAEIELRS